MKIYLVRHGKTDANKNNILAGQKENVQLSEEGIRQANALKLKISNIKFDACFTSPLIRAWSTAMILVGDKVEIKSDPRIMERYLGELEGKEFEIYDKDKYENYSLNSSDNDVEPIQDSAPLLSASIPKLPEPANKSSTILPSI